MANKEIAILGWGSLLWDKANNKQFDSLHTDWQLDGPTIKLEFSRISKSRDGALTLVIDTQHGMPCTVAWCRSRRGTIEEALQDLEVREGTSASMIHHLNRGVNSPANQEPISAIHQWASTKALEYVIWTGLPSNFPDFSLAAAKSHIQQLDAAGKRKAAEYISNAPSFVQTQLRTLLEAEKWFI